MIAEWTFKNYILRNLVALCFFPLSLLYIYTFYHTKKTD